MFAACTAFPKCRNGYNIPYQGAISIEMLDEKCIDCCMFYGTDVFKFKVKYNPDIVETLGKWKETALQESICFCRDCMERDDAKGF